MRKRNERSRRGWSLRQSLQRNSSKKMHRFKMEGIQATQTTKMKRKMVLIHKIKTTNTRIQVKRGVATISMKKKNMPMTIYKKKKPHKMMIMTTRKRVFWRTRQSTTSQESSPKPLLSLPRKMLMMHSCQDYSTHTYH